MARDKLITIRIEGEKRDAFNQLAKSQNTDTASLLYDFISGCLDGRIDIKLVTGKGNRLDNQLDTNRLDKLETTTQRLDERVGQISKKINDWVEAFDDRLTDSDQGLSEKITSLEHRLNALAIQLDSQQDRQRETPDMGTVTTVEIAIDKVETAIETVEAVTVKDETATDTVEAVDTVESVDEPVQPAIGPVLGDSIDTEPGKGMTAKDAAKYLRAKKVKVSDDSLHRWIRQEKIPNTSPQGRDARKHLILRDGLYYPIN